MATVETLWRDVRKARTFNAVVERSNLWLEELWPVARPLGWTRRSTKGFPTPLVDVDDTRGRHTAGYYADDAITLPGAKTLQAQIDRYTASASPTLDAGMINVQLRDYTRAAILHEVRHALDHVDGYDIFLHDKRFFTRLTKLEQHFSPLAIERK